MKAIDEAEKYDGPSPVICYASGINHGIKKGMDKTQEDTNDAVETVYWHLYRYNPTLKEEGKKSIQPGFQGTIKTLQRIPHGSGEILFLAE